MENYSGTYKKIPGYIDKNNRSFPIDDIYLKKRIEHVTMKSKIFSGVLID